MQGGAALWRRAVGPRGEGGRGGLCLGFGYTLCLGACMHLLFKRGGFTAFAFCVLCVVLLVWAWARARAVV
jgi:hypothetical protein